MNDIGEAADHPQLAAIGGVLELPVDGSTIKAAASPFALRGAPTAADRAAAEARRAHRTRSSRTSASTRAEIAALRDEGAFGASAARESR